MKFSRFLINSEICTGIVVNKEIKVIEGDIFGNWTYTGRVYSINEVKLLSPIMPNQIIGIGANYVTKKEDVPSTIPKIPVFFFKPSSYMRI